MNYMIEGLFALGILGVFLICTNDERQAQE